MAASDDEEIDLDSLLGGDDTPASGGTPAADDDGIDFLVAALGEVQDDPATAQSPDGLSLDDLLGIDPVSLPDSLPTISNPQSPFPVAQTQPSAPSPEQIDFGDGASQFSAQTLDAAPVSDEQFSFGDYEVAPEYQPPIDQYRADPALNQSPSMPEQSLFPPVVPSPSQHSSPVAPPEPAYEAPAFPPVVEPTQQHEPVSQPRQSPFDSAPVSPSVETARSHYARATEPVRQQPRSGVDSLFPPVETQRKPQPVEQDDDDDYGYDDEPRRRGGKFKAVLAFIVVALLLAVAAFFLFPRLSNVIPGGSTPTPDQTQNQSPSASDTPATNAPNSEPQSTDAPSEAVEETPTSNSGLTDPSFVASAKSLATKTAASVPESADALKSSVNEVGTDPTDETMGALIDEIVNATKAKSPAEATNSKGSQILSVQSSKTDKGIVIVVTSSGETELSVTVNVDGTIFRFPVQSSTGVATFVYDESIPTSGAYSYVVMSGSQEVSAVRSY